MQARSNGLCKLIESCGGLVQACSQELEYSQQSSLAPTEGPPLTRLEDRIADILAATALVIEELQLSNETVVARAESELTRLRSKNNGSCLEADRG